MYMPYIRYTWVYNTNATTSANLDVEPKSPPAIILHAILNTSTRRSVLPALEPTHGVFDKRTVRML